MSLDDFLKPVAQPPPPHKRARRKVKPAEVSDDQLLALLHRCVNIYKPLTFDVKDFFLGLHEDLGWPPKAIRGTDGYATVEAVAVLKKVEALWRKMEGEYEGRVS